MKLTELNPKWLGNFNVKVGLTFDSPIDGRRLGVFFKPYIDPNNEAWKVMWAMPDANDPNTGEASKNKHWERTGDNFENLTLHPSINVQGNWHGFITNGNIE